VKTIYLKKEVCKSESSQSHESGTHSVNCLKAGTKPGIFNRKLKIVVFFLEFSDIGETEQTDRGAPSSVVSCRRACDDPLQAMVMVISSTLS